MCNAEKNEWSSFCSENHNIKPIMPGLWILKCHENNRNLLFQLMLQVTEILQITYFENVLRCENVSIKTNFIKKISLIIWFIEAKRLLSNCRKSKHFILISDIFQVLWGEKKMAMIHYTKSLWILKWYISQLASFYSLSFLSTDCEADKFQQNLT